MLVINGLLKLLEENSYIKGCLADTAQMIKVDVNYKHEYHKNLIANVCESLGLTVDEISDHAEIATCDEVNRIDISLMENSAGVRASEHEIEQWKHGKACLYSCTYSCHVYEQKEFDLTAQKG